MDRVLERLYLELNTLTVFKGLMDMPVPESFHRLCRAASDNDFTEAAKQYSNVCYHLLRSGTRDMGAHLTDLLKLEDSAFSSSVLKGTADPELESAAKRDFDILASIAKICCRDIKSELERIADGRYGNIFSHMPEWETKQPMDFQELVSFYTENGSGIFARYRAFILSGGELKPVSAPDPVRPGELIGYERQRNAVIDNTRALLAGSRVNNVLLYGDSGTGKSATVKSLLNMDGAGMLRLIQIEKDSLSSLPQLIRDISGRPQKFILFIDDLSFEEGDVNFSFLKVMLEGGLETRPDNAALYVTSNRRQLVKRRFSDADDMNEKETAEEKASLADRFGICIPFLNPGRNEYLDMAEELARRAGVNTDSAALRSEALKWAVEHGSATPRTARQFADYMAAREK